MANTSIRRRLRNLETVLALALLPDYPPLTSREVVDIERRARLDETLSRVELHRLERQSPIIDGELLMTCHRGQVFVKRYLGVDLAEV